jgi:hypothetical protein
MVMPSACARSPFDRAAAKRGRSLGEGRRLVGFTVLGSGWPQALFDWEQVSRFYGILLAMTLVRTIVVIVICLICPGCFQMTTIMKLKGDGSGTIEHRMLFTKQALAQLKQFAALGGGRQAIDPTSEQQAQEMAAALGPGVTYVSSQPVSTAVGEGRDATYAFADVSQLRVSTQPPPPGGASIQAAGISTVGDTLTFSFARQPDGNSVLHVNVPESSLVNSLSTNAAAPQQMSMIKSLLAGAHVLLAVEPDGRLVQTNSAYADGSRVTLLEVDLDQLLRDEALIGRVQAAKTPDELRAAIKDAPGLKLTLEKDIAIEFTPR